MPAYERVTRMLGIEHPILQAPMAGVSTPPLAAAVSEAGALGALGIGASSCAKARAQIEATRALTARPFNVNVFCHAPARRDPAQERAWLAHLADLYAEVGAEPPSGLQEIYPSFLQSPEVQHMLLEQRPAVVSFHFGLPETAFVQALREAGVRTLATATDIDEARRIERAGIDAVVAQGFEAGGHRGVFDPRALDRRQSTAELVRLLVRELALPVIAAGGIMDGRAMRAMFDLGASGVQLGTAFVGCPESAADAGYRQALGEAHAGQTRMTSVLSGRPARGFVNRLVTHAEAADSPPVPDYPLTYDATKQLHAAAHARGRDDFAVRWAGEGAAASRAMPAGALVERLVAEWRQA
ncbi:NAD(P)H-dependent flavin oxidoreductase [Oleiagrimonas soli]|uniref:Nitronate monooxygenase n=1 Tax=Oleiagrimonas soli TaxID=1543381 RepID=A0A099CWE6_9GAMM|nr:nitronate monooxygenase [Oleiagrimonas soli]KGI77962.1 2-nitropropane dioxygenase [Oleiagrimonas soli]MBB6183663.1 nitronate monooxygenase [Oleiagrimonas soli]